MTSIRCLVILLFTSIKLSAQKSGNLIDKTFISSKLDYLEFINDSTLFASFNPYNDTALFTIKGDTLTIQQGYWWIDNTRSGHTTKYNTFKINFSNRDTISIQSISNEYSSKEKKEIIFINLENLRESISNFKYFKVFCSSPWVGEKNIIIDSLGGVFIFTKPFDKKGITLRGQFSNEEFSHFKNLLSNSLVSKLPQKRGCAKDAGTSDFEILIDDKLYKSKGCSLSWPHQFLLNYVYTLDKNRGLVKK
jgi:hypothetical protein